MRTLISFAALFASVFMMQLGSGSLGPLDALSGAAEGFSTRQIGALGSAHFIGFFIGCLVTPWALSRVGHTRAFAAAAAIGAISALLHPIFVSPLAWGLCRVGTGLAIASCFTIAESWMQAKVENRNRGRVISVYRVVDMVGSLGAQVMIGFLEPSSYISYNILAIFCCLCLVPLTLTKQEAPPAPKSPSLEPLKAFRVSPLGAVGVLVVGLTSSSFRMVGPIFGAKNALTPFEIGMFLAAAVLGGALAQPVVGWVADKWDRRWVLIGISAFATAVCATISSGLFQDDNAFIYVASFLFGAAAFPLFSVSAAHANDYAETDTIVELNASLMFLFGAGAIVSPLLAAELIERTGPQALFLYIASAHVLLIAFGFYRMTRRQTAAERQPYHHLPRTSFIFDRLLKRSKNNRI